MNKQYPTAIITLSNMKVKFKKIKPYGNDGKQLVTFQLSQKVWQKDQTLPARYNQFDCITFDKIDPASINDDDIVIVTGQFSTEIYNEKLQLKVVVDKIEKVGKAEEIYKAPNATITPDDLPF